MPAPGDLTLSAVPGDEVLIAAGLGFSIRHDLQERHVAFRYLLDKVIDGRDRRGQTIEARQRRQPTGGAPGILGADEYLDNIDREWGGVPQVVARQGEFVVGPERSSE